MDTFYLSRTWNLTEEAHLLYRKQRIKENFKSQREMFMDLFLLV